MPSLFSRARTTSTPTKKSTFDLGLHDEFGRVSSRGSARQVAQQSLTSGKKGGKKDGAKGAGKARPPGTADDDQVEFGLPDGSFLP